MMGLKTAAVKKRRTRHCGQEWRTQQSMRRREEEREREGEEEKGKGEGTAGKGADRVAGVADA